MAPSEGLPYVRGKAGLSGRIVADLAASGIVALRKQLRLRRQNFADRFGLDVRNLQAWKQGRCVPNRTARVLLTGIDHDPEAVVGAPGEGGGDGRPGRNTLVYERNASPL